MAERIIKRLPLYSVFLIVLGFLKQFIHYFIFGFDISPYLGLQELPLLISPDLLYLFTFLLVLSPIYMFFFLENIKSTGGEKFELIDVKITNPKDIKEMKRVTITFTVILIILSLYVIYKMCTVNSKLELTVLTIGLILDFLIIGFINYNEHLIIYIGGFKNLFKYSMIVSILLFSCLFGFTKANKTIHGHYNGTVIKTNDATYVSNDSIMYIGRTEKYIFIHNHKTFENIVIPSSDVKYFKIKER